EVRADVLAELRNAAVLDAEARRERVVDGRHVRFLHAHDLDLDLRRLAGDQRLAEVRRERGVDREVVAGLVADQRALDLGQERARADQRADAIEAARRMARAAGFGGVFEEDHVARLRRPVDRLERAALHAKRLDHRVDVGVGNARRRIGYLEARDVDPADLRHDLERRRVFDLAVGRRAGRLDRRLHGRAQLFARDRFMIARSDHLGQHLAADLAAETLLDDPGRHLARTEALQARAAAGFLDARADLVLELL